MANKISKEVKAAIKTPKNSLGITYEKFGTEINRILCEKYPSFDNSKVRITSIPDFNLFDHWKANVSIDKTIKIIMGCEDSPFDNFHGNVDLEFYDDYQEENLLYDWEIRALGLEFPDRYIETC